MTQEIRDKYLKNRIQTIVLDKKGTVLDSDDFLFNVPLKTNITELHPFFEVGFSELLEKTNHQDTFYCVYLGLDNAYDIYVNSGNKSENPYLIIYDYTKRYSYYQTVAQEKNESVLNFREEALKNHQLKIEREFKNKFLANISHDLDRKSTRLNSSHVD